MHPLFLYSSGEVFLREDGGGQEPVLKGLQEGEKSTARSGSNDRIIQPQRPHDSGSSTARFFSWFRMPWKGLPDLGGIVSEAAGVF